MAISSLRFVKVNLYGIFPGVNGYKRASSNEDGVGSGRVGKNNNESGIFIV